ncbi:pyridoxal phosphate-dependent aminotransferase [Candidatus Microgenomates bacterium]|nr:pyridoxal phosphate-dependent aminotransferase [Candidatus Microgenomates bacterium]
MSNPEGSHKFSFANSHEALNTGPKPVDLTSGYLPFPIPHVVRMVTAQATLNPELAIQPSGQGLPELRQAASDKFLREYGVQYDPELVLVTNGSSGALRVVLSRFNGLFEGSGSDVAKPKLWTPEVGYDYRKIARYSGIGDVGRYPLKNGVPDVEKIADLFAESEGRNIFLINSPANPTGKIIPEHVLEQLADVFGEQDIAVEDNVFAGMTFDGIKHSSIASHAHEKTIAIGSTSKDGANWQVGWLMAPNPEIYNELLDIREATGGVFPPVQLGAATLLNSREDSRAWTRDEMQRKRDLMYEHLTQIPGYEGIEKPEGGFFYFLPGLPDAERLKEEAGVLITDGKKYGLEGYSRISFAASDEAIVEGVRRMAAYMQS